MNQAGKRSISYPNTPCKLNEYEIFTEDIIQSNWMIKMVYDMKNLNLSLEHIFDYDYISLYNELLNNIPEKNRDAILCYYRDGLAFNKIAQNLGMSPALITQRVYKGFGFLRHPSRSQNFVYNMMPEASDSLIHFFSEKLVVGEPSDTFHFSDKAAIDLRKLYNPKEIESSVPSDLFFNGTIPMMDCNIEIANDDTGNEIVGRVAIDKRYNDITKALVKSSNDEILNVGFIRLFRIKNNDPISYEDMTIIIPFGIEYGYNDIHIFPKFIPKYPDEFLNGLDKIEIYNEHLMKIGTEMLSLWYSIQIALLHPTVKEVIRRSHHNDEESEDEKRKKKWKYKKRETKYVKHHIITDPEEIEKANTQIVKTKSGFVRHCMVWYVIGHWRTYKKTGKKKFIEPYWKGPMRELQRNLDMGRDRELDTPEIQKGVREN